MSAVAAEVDARGANVVAGGVMRAGAALVLGLLVLAAVWPGLFTAYSPTEVDPALALRPPGGGHLLGTDQLGRDIWTRIVYGTRLSLFTGLAATALAVAGGTCAGLLAALGGRAADQAVMRTADVLLALPGMLLALIVITVLGPGQGSALIAIAVSEMPGYARMIRARALVVRRAEYVDAAVVLGLPHRSVVARHILPNSLSPLLVLATLGTGTAILAGSALSFLGLGVRPPQPEWGALLAEGREFLATAWWLALFPGLAITVTVVAVNVMGRHLRLRFEGRRA
ncbi:ABC transporter permease [Nonomuraea insulae]|uniref:ABC transporter permease n=1 Tax=Nonomuraea insulae TaxID=1616787 RepID=A0ABW1CQH7_9ACTN